MSTPTKARPQPIEPAPQSPPQPAPRQEIVAAPPPGARMLSTEVAGMSRHFRELTARFRSEMAEAQEAGDDFTQACLTSVMVAALEHAISPRVMEVLVLPLMGKPYGFKTDRDGPRRGAPQQPYDVETVKRCFVQSVIEGFRPSGNEWMIFKGNFFACKNGWMRKLSQAAGVTDIKLSTGRVNREEGRAIVRVALSWKVNGVQSRLEDEKGQPARPFTINLQGFETDEAIQGKAEARAFRAAYHQATGSLATDEDDLAEPAPALGHQPTASRADQAQAQLAGPAGASQPAVPSRESLVGRLRQARARLGLDDAEWFGVCEELAIPPSADNMTVEHLHRAVGRLEAMVGEMDAASRDERGEG